MLSVEAILGPGGSIARRLRHYEPRPQQLAMAQAVESALAARQHLVVEAGTGTGKSYAYLIPAILHATQDQVEGAAEGPVRAGLEDDEPSDAERPEASRRIVISTHTISLQEQLLAKDLPLLNSVIPREFTAVLAKGRGNYISLRRLDQAITKSSSLLEPAGQEQLQAIRRWSETTVDGSLTDLPIRPTGDVWDEVASDSGNCLSRRCPRHKDCFYFAARRRLQHAQLLVVNHALFFTDLALRAKGISLLPDYAAVILDECHTLEHVASEQLGLRLTQGQVDYGLNKLYNDRTQRGLLRSHELSAMEREVDRIRLIASDFWEALEAWWTASGRSNGRVSTPPPVDDELSPALHELAKQLRVQADRQRGDSDRQDFVSAGDRIGHLSATIDQWLKQSVDEPSVFWLEHANNSRRGPRLALSAAPLDVGPALRKQLFQAGPTVVMTSATLAAGDDQQLTYFRNQVGLTRSRTLVVGSPFDYRRQAVLVTVSGLPDPAERANEFSALLPSLLRRYIAQTDGHAFVLFTSYQLLRQMASALQPWLSQQQLALYSQAEAISRTQLLDAFRRQPRGVLLGTDSFWQGVDVPGDALQNVVITKLPFAVPDHPVREARLELIRRKGGQPFRDYQLPEAVLKLRQGFGRLIRSRTDRGQVVILDPRVLSKPYGRVFLDSLPDCRRVTHHYPRDLPPDPCST
jgi:ATP-dependent DNA helicase DinG